MTLRVFINCVVVASISFVILSSLQYSITKRSHTYKGYAAQEKQAMLKFGENMALSSLRKHPEPYMDEPYVPPPRNHTQPQGKLYVGGRARFGNLLFQFAGAQTLAHYYGRRLVINSRMHRALDAAFAFEERNITSMYSVETFPKNLTLYEHKHPAYGFHIKLFEIEDDRDFEVFSWLQSWQYFQYRYKQIRELYTFRGRVRTEADAVVESFLNSRNVSRAQTTLIGIHVRRGDIADQQEVPTMSYFRAAMEYYQRKYDQALFIVCTNDREWTVDNFMNISHTHVVDNTKEFIVDMAILASCNHTIMSVGTFGWWAGWLAGGQLVYYNQVNRMLKRHFPASGYYMPGWIPISV